MGKEEIVLKERVRLRKLLRAVQFVKLKPAMKRQVWSAIKAHPEMTAEDFSETFNLVI